MSEKSETKNLSPVLIVLIAGIALNVVLMIILFFKSSSSEVSESFKEFIESEKISQNRTIEKDILALDEKLKYLGSNINKASEKLCKLDIIKNRFDNDMSSVIRLITTTVENLKLEINESEKLMAALQVEIADFQSKTEEKTKLLTSKFLELQEAAKKRGK